MKCLVCQDTRVTVLLCSCRWLQAEHKVVSFKIKSHQCMWPHYDVHRKIHLGHRDVPSSNWVWGIMMSCLHVHQENLKLLNVS